MVFFDSNLGYSINSVVSLVFRGSFYIGDVDFNLENLGIDFF